MVEPLYPLRCLLAQASQHLWLVNFDDVYREFTCVHHTIHPAPSPRDARRYTIPSRFRCQSGDCGYRVRRLYTGRYLPAHLRRILLMEQQVWSRQRARRSTLRPRVAATTKSDGMWKNHTLVEITFSILAENAPKVSVVGLRDRKDRGRVPVCLVTISASTN